MKKLKDLKVGDYVYYLTWCDELVGSYSFWDNLTRKPEHDFYMYRKAKVINITKNFIDVDILGRFRKHNGSKVHQPFKMPIQYIYTEGESQHLMQSHVQLCLFFPEYQDVKFAEYYHILKTNADGFDFYEGDTRRIDEYLRNKNNTEQVKKIP